MTHARLLLPLALLLAGCSHGEAPLPDSTTEPATDAEVPAKAPVVPGALTPEGIGPIVVGMPPPPSLEADEVQLSDSCRTYKQDAYPRIFVMTDGKLVTRITAMSGSPVKTERGIATGASEAEVRKAYPEVTEQPHKYAEAPAKYLDWRPGGGNSGLRFEIDRDGRVNAIHAGREPYIEFVEGCA